MDGRPNLMTNSETRRDWLCLGLLILLVLPLRLWLLCNTEVAARDSVGYIRYALHFEQFSWGETLNKHHQHPGYAVTVWLASLPVRAILGTTPESMQVAAQLASTAAAILLLYPMFFLGKLLFNRKIGFWAALWFQVLPIPGHHLSDGISEPWFMLWIALTLYQSILALNQSSIHRFALAGLFSGMAYLTRPEGALVLIAVLAVLGGGQLLQATRQRWHRFLACGGVMTMVALAIGSLYFGFTGKFTHKPSVSQILGTHTHLAPRESRAAKYLQASIFADFIEPSNVLSTRFLRGTKAFIKEFVQVFHYVGALAAVLGLWWFGKPFWSHPASWVLAAYAGLQTLVLIALSMRSFYVSDRHVMLLVLCAIFPATAGLMEAGRRLGAFLAARKSWASPATISIVVLMAVVGFGIPKTTERLHGNRAGNHAAGLWLADHLADGDLVLDDHCWSHYFAGLVFIEGKEPFVPRGYTPTTYTVITRSKDAEIGLKRYRDENQIKESGGRMVYHWPRHRDPVQARVVVYSQPRDFSKHGWNIRD